MSYNNTLFWKPSDKTSILFKMNGEITPEMTKSAEKLSRIAQKLGEAQKELLSLIPREYDVEFSMDYTVLEVRKYD